MLEFPHLEEQRPGLILEALVAAQLVLRAGRMAQAQIICWLSPRHAMRVADQCLRMRRVTCLMTVLTSVPLGVLAGRKITATGVPLAT